MDGLGFECRQVKKGSTGPRIAIIAVFLQNIIASKFVTRLTYDAISRVGPQLVRERFFRDIVERDHLGGVQGIKPRKQHV
ncbi:hypothetical protein AGABI2DRAFT_193029 [Agaricus bisporus var. bisporus H97]|uniref:hypothetical protein n=1 Tax=Agaricus bisporus var. bisporus (strain H97 / ATCC MYA-4626 / FGSC 10389) TaxID=936046 RepID=UPI00029F7112|nr:hypothetical protein AGABI2DRAFT_193029 [Agaricus bisporus var. bisporus H97]EKV46267.1 hypothetical protein AGABI2DRAFT_193029 [Agaricus bisporus var. bisporus H97]